MTTLNNLSTDLIGHSEQNQPSLIFTHEDARNETWVEQRTGHNKEQFQTLDRSFLAGCHNMLPSLTLMDGMAKQWHQAPAPN
jgi:hypothetical protein